jgi:LmbE family N-acetylglucosaminyl deacetylase
MNTIRFGFGLLRIVIALTFLACLPAELSAQSDAAPRVLIVNAHPDDEGGCAVTVYKITHDLKGTVDIALVTNGEGGYKYSTLAEDIYGVELTDEKVGREYLPTIRKKEMMAGGKIIGLRNYFFLDNLDHMYTQNVDSVLTYVWDGASIKKRLREIMEKGKYDYVFCLLPTEDTHGHHKGATILALQTVQELPKTVKKPVVLGVSVSGGNSIANTVFTGLKGYPITAVADSTPVVSFDRTKKFGFRNQLDYRVIVNWLIAEHKSQGVMQLYMNQGDRENFWFFDINDRATLPALKKLFERLNTVTFRSRTY